MTAPINRSGEPTDVWTRDRASMAPLLKSLIRPWRWTHERALKASSASLARDPCERLGFCIVSVLSAFADCTSFGAVRGLLPGFRLDQAVASRLRPALRTSERAGMRQSFVSFT